MKCYLCENESFELIQNGVRDNENLKVIKCKKCELVTLNNFDHITDDFYEMSGMHQDEINILDWLKSTRKDDIRRIKELNNLIKNKSVLDFGSGNCGFILNAKKLSKKIIGIEVEKQFQNYFKKKKLTVYSSINDIKIETKFNLITSFHVFEHLKDPITVLIKLSKHLKKDGEIIIEVPNSDDALLTLYKSKSFAKFTYWSQHLFLFNEKTAKSLVEKSNLKINWIKQVQRYPLSNHLYWLAKNKPGGHKRWGYFPGKINSFYSENLYEILF